MRNIYTKISVFLLPFFFLSWVSYGQDAGVTVLLTPVNSTCGGPATAVKAIVYNYGSSSISTIPVWVSATGPSTVLMKDTLKKTISAGKQDTITFKATFNNSSGGTYTFKVFTVLSGDTKLSNDTLIQKISFYPTPVLSSVSGFTNCGEGPLKFRAKSLSPGTTLWYPTATSTGRGIASGDSINPYEKKTTTLYAMSVMADPFYDSLKTVFTGSNNQNGNMFDVRILKSITIDSMDVSMLSAGVDTMMLYYRSGTYAGNATSVSGWTYAGSAIVNPKTYGTGTYTKAVFPALSLKPGLYGFYILSRGSISTSTSRKINYTNSSGSDSVYTSYLTIHDGAGIQGLFAGGSTAAVFTPRYFNGTFYYSNWMCTSAKTAVTSTIIPPVKGLKLSKNSTSKGVFNAGTVASPDEICVGDSMKYDMSTPSNFTNAEYGTKWKLSYNIRTPKGTSSTNYASTNPSSSVKGLFAFLPKTADADSVFILTVTASNQVSGCDSVFTRYIHVNQLPVSQFSTSNVCYGQALSIKNTSTPAGKIKYLWDFGNGDTSTAAAPAYKYTGAGAYTLTLAVSTAACAAISSKALTIYNAPYGSLIFKGTPFKGQLNTGDIIDPDNVCLNDTNTYQITPPKGLSNGDFGTKWVISSLSFTTSFGNTIKDTIMKLPTSSKNGSFMFFPSKYADSVFLLKITLRTLPGLCDSVLKRYIHIRVKPTAKFGFTNACAGAPIVFKDSSSIVVSSVTNWAWDFGDGSKSTSQNPGHSYVKAGSYKTTLTATSDAGCSSTIFRTVTQYPRAAVKFGSVLSCNGFPASFFDSSAITGGAIAAWKWFYGDGTIGTTQNTTHSYTKSGPYNVKLVTTTSFGCKDSLTKKIKILPKPAASFTYLNACVGNIIYFSNTSIDSSSKTGYIWDFGDGITSTAVVPTHTYPKNGTYKAFLRISSQSGCVDTFKQEIIPNPKPVVNFFFTSGCTGQSIGFSDSSHSGAGSFYTWSFGDGGTELLKFPTTNHVYKKAGTYSVLLSLQNSGGCIDSQRQSITIEDFPKASFTAADVCIGKQTSFVNTSTGPGVLTYKWNFGDKTAILTGKDVTHTFAKAGTYNVKLVCTNASGCTDSMLKPVTVNPLPAPPAWVRDQNHYTVTFIPNDTTLGKYTWFFGTSTNDSSSAKKPTFTYPSADARYEVKLVVTSVFGCSASRTDSIFMGKYGIGQDMNTLYNISVFPNPFESSTGISYRLAVRSKVVINIFDVQGKKVANIKDGMYNAGEYTDVFDTRKYNTTQGVYFLKMYVNDKYYSTRLVGGMR